MICTACGEDIDDCDCRPVAGLIDDSDPTDMWEAVDCTCDLDATA